MAKDDDDNVVVHWRLPPELIEDCRAGAGLDEPSDRWADNLRAVLEDWTSRRRKLRPATHGRAVNKCIVVPPKVLRRLEEEAERLTKETGQPWTVARVVREVWAARRSAA